MFQFLSKQMDLEHESKLKIEREKEKSRWSRPSFKFTTKGITTYKSYDSDDDDGE